MPTYLSTSNASGRITVIRLNPAWVTMARLEGRKVALPPRIDKRHWGIDAIVWERRCAKVEARHPYASAQAVATRAVVLASLLTDGHLTEEQIERLPYLLPDRWSLMLIDSGRGKRGRRTFHLFAPNYPVPPITL
jgi:hypothetical protein